jgi:hypothetical protein
MSEARARLSRLIDLATQNAPEKQRALAFELCDLLLDWPVRYPPAMREPFEVLLEKVLRRLDGTTRRMIAARFAGRADAALPLLNALYLDVPAECRATILQRNAERGDGTVAAIEATDELPLLVAARTAKPGEFAATLAHALQISPATARRMMIDWSGHALAVACKGAKVHRATYSALAVLTATEMKQDAGTRYASLAAYDDIPLKGAERLLQYWRRTREETTANERESEAA